MDLRCGYFLCVCYKRKGAWGDGKISGSSKVYNCTKKYFHTISCVYEMNNFNIKFMKCYDNNY